MATLTTQNTWHGNPRGTVAYADTAYVNSVTSPYIHIPSGGSASTVPTYVSRQGPAPMVLTAAAPVTGGLPVTTTVGGLYSIVTTPTGVWAKGTTLTLTATSLDGNETDTLVLTIPQNTTQDTILNLLLTLINNSGTLFSSVAFGSLLLINRFGFTGGPACIFTAVTITNP
tara:strand:- start:500 stop:1012 length:513 start_codon:yes stop_codon:yes gene_type:complete